MAGHHDMTDVGTTVILSPVFHCLFFFVVVVFMLMIFFREKPNSSFVPLSKIIELDRQITVKPHKIVANVFSVHGQKYARQSEVCCETVRSMSDGQKYP